MNLQGYIYVPRLKNIDFRAYAEGQGIVFAAINNWLNSQVSRTFNILPPVVVAGSRTDAEMANVPAIDAYDKRSIAYELLSRDLVRFDRNTLYVIFNTASQVGWVDTCGWDYYGQRPFPGIASRDAGVLLNVDNGKIGQAAHEIVTHAITSGLKHPWDYTYWEITEVALAEGFSRSLENGIGTWRFTYLGTPRVVRETQADWKSFLAWALADRTVSGAWWRWNDWSDGGTGLLEYEKAILRRLPTQYL